MTEYRFPDGFLWGAGSAAYQVEGSSLADGGGPSIWHGWSHTPGNTDKGVTGDVVADHYRRFREDVQLMREMGLKSYQFSTAWSRILPGGTGPVNQRGLDFYEAVVDACLEADIVPVLSLHVWDLPEAVQDLGGWTNRDCAKWFAEYAATVYDRLGDRVGHWLTMCEPLAFMHFSYIAGTFPPGMKDMYAAMRATHHLMLGQGLAVRAFRDSGAKGVIGNIPVVCDVQPESDSEADVAAAQRASDYFNALFLDPVFLGEFPKSVVEHFGDAWPDISDEDMKTISTPIDFIGLDYYFRWTVAAESGEGASSFIEEKSEAWSLGAGLDVRVNPPAGARTGIDWDITPEGLTSVLHWLKDRYGNPPIYIIEIGAAFDDTVGPDGKIDDPERQAFIRDHLIAAHKALSEGVDLRGIFVWSLLDTWEFDMGTSGRFGLVHIDYETQQRTIKESGHWYSGVMAANGLET